MPSSVLNYYHTINFSIANYMEKEEDAAEYFCNCSQVISREVFCHEYGKIPRHTGQNAITEGDLECILTKLL